MDLQKLYDSTLVSDFRSICKGDEIFISTKRSKRLTRVPPELNEDLAYLSGVIVGDGCLEASIRKSGGYSIKVHVTNKSLIFLNQLNFLFEKYFNYAGYIRKRKNRDYYDLILNNRIIFLYFNRFLGIRKKKGVLSVPPVFFAEPSVGRHFLAGLFDTDGYFSCGAFGIMLKGENYVFLDNIRNFTASLGMHFGKITKSSLLVNGKTYSRASMVLKKGYVETSRASPNDARKVWARPGSNRRPSPCKGYAGGGVYQAPLTS